MSDEWSLSEAERLVVRRALEIMSGAGDRADPRQPQRQPHQGQPQGQPQRQPQMEGGPGSRDPGGPRARATGRERSAAATTAGPPFGLSEYAVGYIAIISSWCMHTPLCQETPAAVLYPP